MSKNLIHFGTEANEVIDLVNALFEQNKSVSKYDCTVMKEYIKTIFELVDHINSLPYGEKRVSKEYLLSEVDLPSWVEPFMFPERVYIVDQTDYFSIDLVDRPAIRSDYEYDPLKVNRAAYMIAQTQKTKPVMKKASEMRGEKAVTEINFSVDGKVKYGVTSLCVPVPIIPAFAKVYREETETLADVKAWVRKWLVTKTEFKAE